MLIESVKENKEDQERWEKYGYGFGEKLACAYFCIANTVSFIWLHNDNGSILITCFLMMLVGTVHAMIMGAIWWGTRSLNKPTVIDPHRKSYSYMLELNYMLYTSFIVLAIYLVVPHSWFLLIGIPSSWGLLLTVGIVITCFHPKRTLEICLDVLGL